MNLKNIVGMLWECSVWRRPLCQTLSKAFSTSMNTEAHLFFLFLACIAIWVSWNNLSVVLLCFLKPAYSSFIMLLFSTYCVSLSVIIFSRIFAISFGFVSLSIFFILGTGKWVED